MKLSEIIGQDAVIKKILEWLTKRKKGKGLLIYGPSGIGKSCIARAITEEKKWDLIELNASDSRTAWKIEEFLGKTINQQSLFSCGKLILIDELDGMAGEDRAGAVGIINVIKKSSFPVILIANDAYDQKLRALREYCELVKMNRVAYPIIEKYLTKLNSEKKLGISWLDIKKIAKNANGDVRAALIDLENCLGERERSENIFDVVMEIFNSKDILAVKKAIENCDKEKEEIFWWIEENLTNVYEGKELTEAFELLSRIDMLRRRNWSGDEMAGLGFISHKRGWVSYKPPRRFMNWFRASEEDKEKARKLHCSVRILKREF